MTISPRRAGATLFLGCAVALVPALVPASAAPVTPASVGAETPVFERFALRGMAVERKAVRVKLVRKGSGDAVPGATVRFRGNSAGQAFSARRTTGARGVARWELPRVSSRFRYLEATYRPRATDTTYVRVGLCRTDGRWRECGAG